MHKIISENPCKNVSLPKLERKEMQTIPAEQLQAFLEEAKRSGVYEMYYIELSTGLRRGELPALKWSDIDWENRVITVRRQVVRVNGEITEAPCVKDICGLLSRFHTLLCNSGFPDGLQHLLTDVGIEGSEKLAVILT